MKSVVRVLEVISTFHRIPRALSAIEVEKLLGYPRSSTLEVLKTLVQMGYLSFDQIAKTYYPTMLVAALGASGAATASVFSNIAATMAEISARTGGVTYLVSQNGFDAQIMAISEAAAEQTDVGRRAGLFESVEGLALLANLKDAQIARLVARHKARGGVCAEMDVSALLRLRADTRRLGYAIGPSGFFEGSVTVWPLTDGDGHPVALAAMSVAATEAEALTAIVQPMASAPA